jgi:hypothetical protein
MFGNADVIRLPAREWSEGRAGYLKWKPAGPGHYALYKRGRATGVVICAHSGVDTVQAEGIESRSCATLLEASAIGESWVKR